MSAESPLHIPQHAKSPELMLPYESLRKVLWDRALYGNEFDVDAWQMFTVAESSPFISEHLAFELVLDELRDTSYDPELIEVALPGLDPVSRLEVVGRIGASPELRKRASDSRWHRWFTEAITIDLNEITETRGYLWADLTARAFNNLLIANELQNIGESPIDEQVVHEALQSNAVLDEMLAGIKVHKAQSAYDDVRKLHYYHDIRKRLKANLDQLFGQAGAVDYISDPMVELLYSASTGQLSAEMQAAMLANLETVKGSSTLTMKDILETKTSILALAASRNDDALALIQRYGKYYMRFRTPEFETMYRLVSAEHWDLLMTNRDEFNYSELTAEEFDSFMFERPAELVLQRLKPVYNGINDTDDPNSPWELNRFRYALALARLKREAPDTEPLPEPQLDSYIARVAKTTNLLRDLDTALGPDSTIATNERAMEAITKLVHTKPKGDPAKRILPLLDIAETLVDCNIGDGRWFQELIAGIGNDYLILRNRASQTSLISPIGAAPGTTIEERVQALIPVSTRNSWYFTYRLGEYVLLPVARMLSALALTGPVHKKASEEKSKLGGLWNMDVYPE